MLRAFLRLHQLLLLILTFNIVDKYALILLELYIDLVYTV